MLHQKHISRIVFTVCSKYFTHCSYSMVNNIGKSTNDRQKLINDKAKSQKTIPKSINDKQKFINNRVKSLKTIPKSINNRCKLINDQAKPQKTNAKSINDRQKFINLRVKSLKTNSKTLKTSSNSTNALLNRTHKHIHAHINAIF